MPYDFVVCKDETVVLLGEIDGEQHFRPGRFGSADEKFERTLSNDVQKELDAVRAGIPLIRMYQDDVWTQKFDWKSWLSTLISKACRGCLDARVYRQPNQLAYTSGEYALRRAGSIVRV